MVLKQFPWSSRLLALPFLTILAPSEKADQKAGKRHKTTLEWTAQLVKLLRRWLPNLRLILTTDGGFANIQLGWTVLKHRVCLISRLRLDARLFDFPPITVSCGRPAKKGMRLLTPKEMLRQKDIPWQEAAVKWYGGKMRRIGYVTTTCLWGVQGQEPLPIRLVLLKDLEGAYEPIALMGVDYNFQLTAVEIIEWFVARWNQEVTHREVREHLGVETQRQWSDKAIARTTPVLFGLYSMIVLMADMLHATSPIQAACTAWYNKECLTFSDLLREVRRQLWRHQCFNLVDAEDDHNKTPFQECIATLVSRLAEAA